MYKVVELSLHMRLCIYINCYTIISSNNFNARQSNDNNALVFPFKEFPFNSCSTSDLHRLLCHELQLFLQYTYRMNFAH